MSAPPEVALSIKQPWATLVVHGLKTIEIRRWPTLRRGRVLIHAGKVPDDRLSGWARVPTELESFARLRGGIVGAVEVADCLTYRTLEEFTRDQGAHCNEPEWFEPPALYGFQMGKPETVAFRPYAGWFKFFTVEP